MALIDTMEVEAVSGYERHVQAWGAVVPGPNEGCCQGSDFSKEIPLARRLSPVYIPDGSSNLEWTTSELMRNWPQYNHDMPCIRCEPRNGGKYSQ